MPIQFEKQCDLLVCGAGVAGVAAALTATREGMDIILIDKLILPGGLCTSGLVRGYAPIFDNQARQIAFGCAEEFARIAFKYGPGEWPENWTTPNGKWVGTPQFNAMSFVFALDEVLEEAGVETWWDTTVYGAVMENDTIVGAEVLNKSGRGVIRADAFIDATGDADLAFRAGAPCVVGENYLSTLSVIASIESSRKAVEADSGEVLVKGKLAGGNFDGSGHPEYERKYHGTSGSDVSDFVRHSRRLQREQFRQMQEALGPDGRRKVFPACLSTMADYRTTRRIDGQATLGNDDCGRHFDDSVSVILDWHNNRDLWEMPWGALVPKKIKGLLAAGRVVSADDYAWEIARIIPICIQTGELAGLAASMAKEKDVSVDDVDVRDFQQRLKERGWQLDLRELPVKQYEDIPSQNDTGRAEEVQH